MQRKQRSTFKLIPLNSFPFPHTQLKIRLYGNGWLTVVSIVAVVSRVFPSDVNIDSKLSVAYCIGYIHTIAG